MTKEEVKKQFNMLWSEAVKKNPRLENDHPAKRESWNNYTDLLCKDGLITQKQYDTWTGL